MGTVVVDSNVLIAFLDPNDAQHPVARERLTPWLAIPHDMLLPASVYGEILVAPIRIGRTGEIERFLQESRAQIMELTREIARQAAQLRADSPSLRLPDALVAATAVHYRAVLLTLDLRLQKMWENRG